MTHTPSVLSPWTREYITGCVAGAANVVTGFPFDTVKVHLQASSKTGNYRGPLDCALSIYRYRGVSGFFQGVSSPLIGGAIECGINYLVYSRVLSLLKNHDGSPPTLAQTGGSAAIAGVALSTVLGPAELIKCRMQLEKEYYKSPANCVRTTIREEGYRGLLRGSVATLAREIPGNAIFFATYEGVKRQLIQPWPSQAHVNHASHSYAHGSDQASDSGHAAETQGTGRGSNHDSLAVRAYNLASMTAAGGVAGCVMWTIVLPIDTAKTRLQAARPGSTYDIGLLGNLRVLMKEGGIRPLWSGLGPTLLRAFPANAAQWIAWELSMQAMAGEHDSA